MRRTPTAPSTRRSSTPSCTSHPPMALQPPRPTAQAAVATTKEQGLWKKGRGLKCFRPIRTGTWPAALPPPLHPPDRAASLPPASAPRHPQSLHPECSNRTPGLHRGRLPSPAPQQTLAAAAAAAVLADPHQNHGHCRRPTRWTWGTFPSGWRGDRRPRSPQLPPPTPQGHSTGTQTSGGVATVSPPRLMERTPWTPKDPPGPGPRPHCSNNSSPSPPPTSWASPTTATPTSSGRSGPACGTRSRTPRLTAAARHLHSTRTTRTPPHHPPLDQHRYGTDAPFTLKFP